MSADVYVLSGAGREVLYVGRSIHVPLRMTEHRRQKPWWPEVATVDVVHLLDRKAQERCEIELIRELRPHWNVMDVPKGDDWESDWWLREQTHVVACRLCGSAHRDGCPDGCGHPPSGVVTDVCEDCWHGAYLPMWRVDGWERIQVQYEHHGGYDEFVQFRVETNLPLNDEQADAVGEWIQVELQQALDRFWNERAEEAS